MMFEPGWRKWCKIAVGLIDPAVSANAASSIVCAKILQPARNDFGNQLLLMQRLTTTENANRAPPWSFVECLSADSTHTRFRQNKRSRLI
jgi:hypothetical protein